MEIRWVWDVGGGDKVGVGCRGGDKVGVACRGWVGMLNGYGSWEASLELPPPPPKENPHAIA